MKKLRITLRNTLYFVLALVFMGGCCPNNSNVETIEKPKIEARNYTITSSDKNSVNFGLQTIDYEGCEYIIYKDNGRSQVEMIHKHNCKYCKERTLAN